MKVIAFIALSYIEYLILLNKRYPIDFYNKIIY